MLREAAYYVLLAQQYNNAVTNIDIEVSIVRTWTAKMLAEACTYAMLAELSLKGHKLGSTDLPSSMLLDYTKRNNVELSENFDEIRDILWICSNNNLCKQDTIVEDKETALLYLIVTTYVGKVYEQVYNLSIPILREKYGDIAPVILLSEHWEDL